MYLLYENWIVFICKNKNWAPFIQGCFVPSLFEINRMVLENNILNVADVYVLFRYYLFLENGLVLNFNKCPLPKDALRQVWLKLAHWFWTRKFWNFVNVFCFYLPLEKGVTLHLYTFEFTSPNDALCQVWFNRPCVKM